MFILLIIAAMICVLSLVYGLLEDKLIGIFPVMVMVLIVGYFMSTTVRKDVLITKGMAEYVLLTNKLSNKVEFRLIQSTVTTVYVDRVESD